ncbi:TPA: accessory Sec system protein translocase subunit SecY2 [Streptococcus suis]|nr:accessory Sec system protein translocase subunit SecY2 [Streptococcus suis]HEM6294118.1 accessory Sec system protein translocase subunit SecY2 [Streptococcus suis]HEM6400939.1 accessory Sec system protein translocase subunit SecY2 [Streptococcus suis]
MKRLFLKHPIINQIAVSSLIIMIFLAGRYIPVPLGTSTIFIGPRSKLPPWYQIPSSSLTVFSIFALGLGPWMYATILISLFSIGSKQVAVSPRVSELRKNSLMFVLALIQGLGVAITLNYGESVKASIIDDIFFVSLVMIAGAYVVSWFANMNTAYGLGGTSLIILINIIVGQFTTFPLFFELFQSGLALVGFLLLGWIVFSLYLSVVLDQAEYRIPIQRIAIKSDLMKEAYMPIKLNIAGGMPFMYAYTLLAFPQYIFLLLSFLFPKYGPFFQVLGSYFVLTRWEGIVFFLAILALLTVAFSFTTINPTDKSKEMRKSGDYIPFVRPGQPTKDYLTAIVLRIATINAIFLMCMAGIPMLASLGNPDIQPVAGLPGIIMMVVGIVLTTIKEVRVARLKKRYSSLFTIE